MEQVKPDVSELLLGTTVLLESSKSLIPSPFGPSWASISLLQLGLNWPFVDTRMRCFCVGVPECLESRLPKASDPGRNWRPHLRVCDNDRPLFVFTSFEIEADN